MRANYARILIYRHHLMSASSIAANLTHAWLVVDIAQDTIQVLVHLHTTTDIYSRQQTAFNYFLLSAIAVIFLAVCHAPTVFAANCRKPFHDAVDIVRGLSGHSIVSRRLWKSIRGLIPRIKTLSSDLTTTTDAPAPAAAALDLAPCQTDGFAFPEMAPGPGADFNNSLPDMFQMKDDLLNLFDAFGQQRPQQQKPQLHSGQLHSDQLHSDQYLALAQFNSDEAELSQRFNGLIQTEYPL